MKSSNRAALLLASSLAVALACAITVTAAIMVLSGICIGPERPGDLVARSPASLMSGHSVSQVSLRRSGALILVDVEIENGQYPFKFDTGTQHTFVDVGLSELLADSVVRLGTAGYTLRDGVGSNRVTHTALRLREMRIGDARFADVLAPAIDLSPLRDHSDEEVAGIVGFEHFSEVATRIALRNGVMEIGVDSEDLKPESSGVVPLTMTNSKPFVEVAFDGHVVACLIDTGATGTFMVPTPIFDRLVAAGDDEDAVSERTAVSISGEAISLRSLTREVVVTLGPHEMKATLDESPRDFGILGQQVLEHFVVTLDPVRGLARFELVDRSGVEASSEGSDSPE